MCLDIYCCCDDYLGLGGDRPCTAWMFVCLASRGKERAQQRSGGFALHWKTVQLGHAFTLHSGPTSWWRPWRIHGNTATCRFSVINTGLLEVGSGNLGCLAIRKRRNHRCEKVRFTSGFFPSFLSSSSTFDNLIFVRIQWKCSLYLTDVWHHSCSLQVCIAAINSSVFFMP